MKNLSKIEKEYIRGTYSEYIGNTIKHNRVKKNISQEELAEFIDMDRASVSRYESGLQDINASILPLISICCDFPMKEFINPAFDKELIAKFRKIVSVEAEKQHKLKVRSSIKPKKELMAKIYMVDGKRVVEEIPKRKTESYFKRILSGEVVLDAKPFTEEEFLKYMQLDRNHRLCAIIDAGSGFLDCLQGQKKKDTLKTMVSEYVLRELIFNDLSGENEQSKRFCMFYKKELDDYMTNLEK